MRAKEILSQRNSDELRVIAQALRAPAADTDSILHTMRSPEVFARIEKVCESQIMREDFALICANPFDAVEPDELAKPDVFQRIGLIHLDDKDKIYRVNVDLALTCVPRSGVEFGFTATLLARLAPEQLTQVARALEVGPRPSLIDTILDVAAAARDEVRLMQQIAHLNEAKRAVIREALSLGELPDDISDLTPNMGVPLVTLDEGEAGSRGIVFWIDHEERGWDSRPVVGLELLEKLPSILTRVPPPPDVIATRASKPRAPRAASSPKKVVKEDFESPAPTGGLFLPGFSVSSLPKPIEVPKKIEENRGPVVNRGGRLARISSVKPASALVEFDAPNLALAAQRDDELSAGILEVIGDQIVILRPGVDAREWSARAATRLM
jgi:hypothetical protein